MPEYKAYNDQKINDANSPVVVDLETDLGAEDSNVTIVNTGFGSFFFATSDDSGATYGDDVRLSGGRSINQTSRHIDTIRITKGKFDSSYAIYSPASADRVTVGGTQKEFIRNKFGYNDSVGSASPELVSTLSNTVATFGGFLQTATAVRVKAGGDANDTAAGTGLQRITVEGLDANFDIVSETIELAGASASAATTQTFIRALRAYGGPGSSGTYHGNNVGEITIEDSGGTVDLLHIATDTPVGQTESAFDCVPAGMVGILDAIFISVETAKAVSLDLCILAAADDTTAPFSGVQRLASLKGVEGTFSVDGIGAVIPEKTDVWFAAISSAGNSGVSVNFQIKLVEVA